MERKIGIAYIRMFLDKLWCMSIITTVMDYTNKKRAKEFQGKSPVTVGARK